MSVSFPEPEGASVYQGASLAASQFVLDTTKKCVVPASELTIQSKGTTISVLNGSPPFVVFKMVPSSPTAKPVVLLIKYTECRLTVVPLTCLIQVAPASMVFKMVPLSPTT